jgi:two-component system sensor histidine kinase KdpD
VSETALRAIAHLAALSLDRAHTQEAASRAEAARQSEELKSTLLDAFAHECKTPLTSIKAAVTSVLSENSIQPAHKELLQIVDEETDRLTAVVTDAIQMARIEAGQIELRKGPRSIAGLIHQSLAKMAGNLDARPVEVRVNEDLPPVAADPELIHIVIRQLLDNAIKYSPPDSPILIEAMLEEDAVIVSVADRGPGVAEQDRNRVFEKFYRGREARERIPGTGMGLAIAREIVRAHNGDIRVEGRSGPGSRFLFSLPVVKEPVRT